MRVALLLLSALALCGCSLIYKLPTRQGNVIEQKQLDQLQVGMSKDQVRYLLGTPIAASPFRTERWDYLGYYKSPRGEAASRLVSIYFDAGKLSRMEGVQVADNAAIVNPDAKDVVERKKKEKVEDSRAKGDEDLHNQLQLPLPSTQPNSPDADKLPNP
ncbi:MAG TPA: outer membrane protein assembly factor BamE [Nevskiaceae bacterium]|nr:outer membrane protein assembly factor BamE [Nevskiaceae bacterium]